MENGVQINRTNETDALDELRSFLSAHGLDCSDAQLSRYEAFADLTLEWNEKINVTAIREKEAFLRLNVLDSLALAGFPVLERATRILDLGTGGGLPGMPLAIAYPDKKFVLTDAIGKKLRVVSDVAEKLGISNVEVIHARAEDLARESDFRERFDLVVSRAVAAMPVLMEYCLPFADLGGYVCAYKTEDAAKDIDAAARAIELLGGGSVDIQKAGISGSGHLFVLIKKERLTPPKYPRRAGEPGRDPL